MPRNVNLLHRKNGAGGLEATWWVLIHTCSGSKKHVWHVWPPAGKNQITANTPPGGTVSLFFDVNATMEKPNTSEIDILCPVLLKDTQMSKKKYIKNDSYLSRPPGVPQSGDKT